MRYLLDTNAVISMLNQADRRVVLAAEKHRRQDVVTSSIVVHELYFGAYKSALTQKNVAAIELLNIAVLEFDSADAREAGRVRALLAGKGKPIGPYDLLIAGQALRHDLVLVTANIREFRQVPGLICEDWSR